jgi:hypothetical protein
MSFERRISPALPRTGPFDIWSLFRPRPMLDWWAEYMNSCYIKLPGHVLYNTIQSPRTKLCRRNAWKPTLADEILIYVYLQRTPTSIFRCELTTSPLHHQKGHYPYMPLTRQAYTIDFWPNFPTSWGWSGSWFNNGRQKSLLHQKKDTTTWHLRKLK